MINVCRPNRNCCRNYKCDLCSKYGRVKTYIFVEQDSINKYISACKLREENVVNSNVLTTG